MKKDLHSEIGYALRGVFYLSLMALIFYSMWYWGRRATSVFVSESSLYFDLLVMVLFPFNFLGIYLAFFVYKESVSGALIKSVEKASGKTTPYRGGWLATVFGFWYKTVLGLLGITPQKITGDRNLAIVLALASYLLWQLVAVTFWTLF